MVLLITVAAGTISYSTYKSEKNALLEATDSKLFAVASMAKATLPPDYHDRIVDRSSISGEEFERMVNRNNLLCKMLDLQYIWSCMQVGNDIVFTSSTSPDKNVEKGNHAKFFDVHQDPHSFDTVFSTMKPDYSSFKNQWGNGRMVLIPGTDKNGRKYCFGASLSVERVNEILFATLQKPLFLSLLILLIGICATVLLAHTTSKPIIELTSIAEDIARGNFDRKLSIGGTPEINSLSHSIDAMRVAIKERITEVTESEQRFRRIFDEGLIGIALVNTDARFININPAFCKITGYSREELLSKTITDVTHPDHIKIDMANLKLLANNEIRYYRTKKQYIRKDGKVVWANVNVSAIRDQSGKILYFQAMIEDITDTEEANLQLVQNEEKFRTLFENMTEGVAIHEVIYDENNRAVNYRIANINPAFEQHTGISPAQAKGKLATELYGTESAPYLPIYAKVAETGTPHHMEAFFSPMNKYFNITCCSLKRGWFATVFTDITEKKQMEETIVQNEEKFRSLVESSSDWIWETDKNGICTYSSPQVQSILGYTPAELTGKKTVSLIASDELNKFSSILAGLYASPKLFNGVEHKCIHKDGHIVILEGSGAPFYNSNGIFKGYRGINRDITEHKRTEEILKEKEEKYRTLFENASDAIFLLQDDQFIDCNIRTLEMFGCKSRDQILGHPPYEFSPPLQPNGRKSSELAIELIATALAGKPQYFEWQHAKLDGTPFSAEISLNSIKLRGKTLVQAIVHDITKQKKDQEALRLSAEQLRANLENTPNVAVQWYELSGRIMYWNHASEMIYGWKSDEAVGKTLDALIYTPEQTAEFRNLLQEIHKTGKPAGPYESEFRRRDGSKGWLISTTFGLPTGGDNVGFVCMDVDISDRKRAEEEVHRLNANLEQRVQDRTLQLEMANKELKSFAYSVSHDLRAPLRSIDGFSTAILEDYADKLDDEGRDYLQRLRRSSQRMASLIDDMLRLSKVTSGEMYISSVNLSQIAEDVIAELKEIDPQRNVETVIAPDITVSGDQQLMYSMMENLIGNAWKFTSKKSTAKIEFGTTKHDNETVYYVRDNGAGFDMAFVGKLFCAFQRLHMVDDYPGDGIGLASIQRIIHRHGGRVWAEGKQNEGATFYFTMGSDKTAPKEA